MSFQPRDIRTVQASESAINYLKQQIATLTRDLQENAALRKERDELAAHCQALIATIPFPAITSGHAHSIAYHFSQDEPFAGLTKAALITWLEGVHLQLEAFNKAAKSTPADSLKAVMLPTIERLRRAATLAQIAADWDLGTNGKVEIDDVWVSCRDLRQEFVKEKERLEGMVC